MRHVRPVFKGAAVALLLLLTSCATGLSTQGAKPASPAPQTTPTAPAPPLPDSVVTTAPLLPPSALPATPPPSGDTRNAINTQPADTLAPPAPHIAIILPLNSRTLGKAADAVRQGFLAGANADGKSAPAFRVYSADDEAGSLAAQYRKARSDGANVVVGGVTRDGASMMARESSNYLPSLALNAPGVANENEFPDRFFYISLNLDWEARFGARTAANEGLRRAAILASTSPLSKRVQESFEKEWSRLGGEIAARIAVAGDASEGLRIQTSMERANADVVFLAAEMKVARFARPYLPTGIPVFATSLTIDPRADAVDNLDLDSVRFMEMPWFVQPDHPAVMAYAKPAEPLPIEYERLYALGIDAWRLAQMVMTNDKPKTFVPLDGVTGRITLEGHQFVRQLASGEMRDGRPVLFKPVE